MSTPRRRRVEPPPFAWVLCPDCNSTVRQVVYGEPPRAVLSIEVEHSDTCPAWREDGNEIALAFGSDRADIGSALGIDEDELS